MTTISGLFVKFFYSAIHNLHYETFFGVTKTFEFKVAGFKVAIQLYLMTNFRIISYT